MTTSLSTVLKRMIKPMIINLSSGLVAVLRLFGLDFS
jgi:hypothetical protein